MAPDNEKDRPAKAAPTVSTAISTKASLTDSPLEVLVSRDTLRVDRIDPDPADGGDRGPQEDYDPARLEVYDRDALAECETVIERGLETFYAIGRSLLTIRDRRLYREQYGTFEDYLRDRWGIDRTYANRLIQSAKVVETLPIGNTPTSEAQSRELVPLLMAGQPEEVRRVWAEANERTGNKPTAAVIRQVREDRNAKPETTRPEVVEPKPRRRPLPDAYWDAIYDLEKIVKRLERLHRDDRFLVNRKSLIDKHARGLSDVHDRLFDLDGDLSDTPSVCHECDERLVPGEGDPLRNRCSGGCG